MQRRFNKASWEIYTFATSEVQNKYVRIKIKDTKEITTSELQILFLETFSDIYRSIT